MPLICQTDSEKLARLFGRLEAAISFMCDGDMDAALALSALYRCDRRFVKMPPYEPT